MTVYTYNCVCSVLRSIRKFVNNQMTVRIDRPCRIRKRIPKIMLTHAHTHHFRLAWKSAIQRNSRVIAPNQVSSVPI